jgi:hypothetical protein
VGGAGLSAEEGARVFLFVAKGGKEICDLTESVRLRKMAKAARVKLTYKSLCRGFGYRYASRVPAQVLQKLKRHASIRTTMDYYASVDDAAMEAVLGRKRDGLRNKSWKPGQTLSEGNVANNSLEGTSD